MQNEFDKFREILSRKNRFLLTTHVNPDPDAIGSELALARFLQARGHIVAILNHSPIPANCVFLDPAKSVQQFDPLHDANMVLDADVVVVLDANQPDRVQSLKPYILNSKAFKICIDHHLDAVPFADLTIIDVSAAATGEILARLFEYLEPAAITPDIASPLYAAIMTDTGSFRFPKTDAQLHTIVSLLIERGADPVKIYHELHEQGSANRIQLLGLVLSTLQLAHGGKVAYLIVKRTMFEQTSTSEEDIENVINFTLSIAGVQVGMMFTELRDGVKISFRSRGDIPVNQLAQEFGGNGHKNAAGARVSGADLDILLNRVVERSQHYIA